MLRVIVLSAAVLAGYLAFAPTKANAGVYVRAPYFSLNVARPYYRPYRYRRPYYSRPYYGRRYYRPHYRAYRGRPYYKRRWRRRW